MIHPVTVEIGVLGQVVAWTDGEPIPLPARRQRELLALLVLRSGSRVDAGGIADALWDGNPPASAATTVRSLVSRLVKALGADVIEGGRAGYLLALDDDAVDARRFERLAREGRHLLEAGELEEADAVLGSALGLWRGPAFGDLAEEPFVRQESARLDELRLEALECRYEAELELGRPAEMVGELHLLVEEHPYRERFWSRLIVALYRAGRQVDALQAYERFRRTMADDLGLEPGDELRRLQRSILRQELETPPTIVTRLPTPLTTFVGRRRELSELRLILRHSRLVTLTGSAGSGKTRLAIEAVRSAGDEERTRWVGLASVADGRLVPQRLADAVGARETAAGRSPIERAADALGESDTLLLLDNCEHVLESAAASVSGLLEACPNAQVLATSREALRVPGETVYPVEPLDPDRDGVRLFEERASEAQPGFREKDRRETIAALCRELDGLPLAIELAAAHVRTLAVEQIADRLDARFRFLRYWGRSGIPRHRTLGAAIDWSYDLLAEEEQRLLAALGVFAGGFTLEAAAAVGSPAGDDLERHFERLVEHSLVVVDERPVGRRFRLLETIREYALERLRNSGSEDEARAAHFEFFLALAQAAWDLRDRPGEDDCLDTLEQEHDNIRGALEWTLGSGQERGALLARAAGRFWRFRGHLDEAREWTEQALAAAGGDATELRADLLGLLGHLAARRALLAEADRLLEEAVATAHACHAHWSEAAWLQVHGFVAVLAGRYDDATLLLERSIAVSVEHGNLSTAAWATGTLADAAERQQRFDDAQALYERGFELVHAAGDPPGHVVAFLESMARLAFARGEHDAALALAEEGLARARDLGDTWHVGLLLLTLAGVARHQGRVEEARSLALESLISLWRIRDPATVADCLELLGSILLDGGASESASTLWGAAAAARERHHVERTSDLEPGFHADLQKARAVLDDECFETAFEAGRQLTAEQIVARTLG